MKIPNAKKKKIIREIVRERARERERNNIVTTVKENFSSGREREKKKQRAKESA